MPCTYLKTETDRLRVEKLPVRVLYRDEDGSLHCVWQEMSTGDRERYVASLFPDEEVTFHTDPAW